MVRVDVDADLDVGVGRLAGEVAAALSVDVDRFGFWPGAQRDLAWMDVERLRRRLGAVQAELTAACLRTDSYALDGHRSPAAWLAAVGNADRRTAAALVARARLLAAMPHLAAAFAAGDVGEDQLRCLTRLWANPRCRPQLPDSDELLTRHAAALEYLEFVQVCQRWQAHADPDGTHRDHVEARARRGITIRKRGAGFVMTVRGDAESGAVFEEILDEHAEAEYLTDVAERAAVHGDNADDVPLARTAAHRRYDALHAALLKAAGTNETTERLPLVVIHATQHVLNNGIRALFGQPTLDEPSERLRLCETASGAPVDPITAAVAALIGRVQYIVSDPNGVPIKLGRKSRLFVGAARQAVLLMGDRCTRNGCNIRGSSIQIDHLNPWTLNGLTDPDNGGPLCGTHNRDKHVHRVTCKRDETGWHYYRADGTEIAPRTR